MLERDLPVPNTLIQQPASCSHRGAPMYSPLLDQDLSLQLIQEILLLQAGCIRRNLEFSMMQCCRGHGGGRRASMLGGRWWNACPVWISLLDRGPTESFSAQPLGSLLLHGSCASSLSDQGIKVTFGFSCCHTALHIEDKQKPELVCDCISSRWCASSAFQMGVRLFFWYCIPSPLLPPHGVFGCVFFLYLESFILSLQSGWIGIV